MDPPEKCPAFFKVFIPARSSQNLRIPLSFTAHVKQLIPDKAYLRNRKGKLWPVEVTKIGNDLFFQDGWVRFIQDNSVEFGDFFVFQYDGNYVFDFILLERTACEKKVGNCDFKVKEEDDEEEKQGEEEETGEDKEEDEEFEEEENEEVTEDDYDEDDEEFEDEEEEEDGNEEEEEEDSNEELEEENFPKTRPKTCEKSVRCKRNAAAKAEGRDKSSGGVEIEYDVVFESGKYVRPKNPYFVTKMRNTRRSELYIPLDVVKDHDINLGPKIVLKDEEGREWNSKVVVWKDGRTWLSRGWKAFCKWNHVKDQDLCICEFVRGRGREDTFIQVRIARVGSW